MTAEALAYLVAIGLPIMTLALLARLILDVRGLERSRDEVVELAVSPR